MSAAVALRPADDGDADYYRRVARSYQATAESRGELLRDLAVYLLSSGVGGEVDPELMARLRAAVQS